MKKENSIMALLHIYKLHETTWTNTSISLRQKSQKVSTEQIETEEFKTIIADMFETLYNTSNGVGLAAPQVGIQLNVIVIDIKRNAKKPLVLINPKYLPIGTEKIESRESCLSVPGVYGMVERFKCVKVCYIDAFGQRVEREVNGFEAKVFQHEIDHLEGILYIDRIKAKENIIIDIGKPKELANIAVEKCFTKEQNIKNEEENK